MRIIEFEPTRIILHSVHLIEAIQGIVSYYPPQVLTGQTLKITEPYPVLMHHYDELTKLYENHLSKLALGSYQVKAELYHHLQVLLHFLQPTIENVLRPIQERLKGQEPVVTFNDLWYLFRPGHDIYRRNSTTGLPQAAVLVRTQKETVTEAADRGVSELGLRIECFTLESNGSKITRNYEGLTLIEYFEGEKSVLSLEAYPCELCDTRDGGAR